MKNLHLLPTEKPSKIFYIAENFHLEKGQLIEPKSYHNVYITSDEEIKEGELKKGDWYYSPIHNKIFQCIHNNECFELERKIILTTDQNLIADGVQAIADTFLEWFVKNPSCDNVEIDKTLGCTELDAICDFGDNLSCPNSPNCLKNKYKTIIPQEEPKQSLSYEESVQHILTAHKIPKEYFGEKEDPIQETVEEAAAREFPLLNTGFLSDDEEDLHLLGHRKSFIKGAKWQAERMYSEEVVLKLLEEYEYDLTLADNLFEGSPKQWFEQFKKK